MAVNQTTQALQSRGIDSSAAHQGALGSIYGQLVRQAAMMSFNDAFYLLSVSMVCILPLVFLMKKGKGEAPVEMH
jgi:DHA2 family multidrug resistance protein